MNFPKILIFPILVLLISIGTVYNLVQQPMNIFAILSITVGLAGIAMYFLNYRRYDLLFYIWVVMQIPNVFSKDVYGGFTPILNAFPGNIISIPMQIGMNMGSGTSVLFVYINILPIGFYFLLKYLNAEKPLGQEITMGAKKGAFPDIPFPIKGRIEKVFARKGFRAVYQVLLDQEVTVQGKPRQFAILLPKDKSLIDLSDAQQICLIRFCDVDDLLSPEARGPMRDVVAVVVK
jgi:hypothetical protein